MRLRALPLLLVVGALVLTLISCGTQAGEATPTVPGGAVTPGVTEEATAPAGETPTEETPAASPAVTETAEGTATVAPGGVVTPTGTLTGTVSPTVTGTTTPTTTGTVTATGTVTVTGTVTATGTITATGTVTGTAVAEGTPTGPAAGGVAGARQELIDQGETVFVNNCARCHGENGEGVGDIYPALNDNEFVTQDNPLPVVRQVVRGGGGMPPYGDVLSNQEIAAVVTYIRNAWDNDATLVDEAQVEEIMSELGDETPTS